jgi:hypothetical protein
MYVHWIYQPDDDRDPHDHPWPFVSFVIRGGYAERLFADLDVSTVRERRRWSPCTGADDRGSPDRHGGTADGLAGAYRQTSARVGFLDREWVRTLDRV